MKPGSKTPTQKQDTYDWVKRTAFYVHTEEREQNRHGVIESFNEREPEQKKKNPDPEEPETS